MEEPGETRKNEKLNKCRNQTSTEPGPSNQEIPIEKSTNEKLNKSRSQAVVEPEPSDQVSYQESSSTPSNPEVEQSPWRLTKKKDCRMTPMSRKRKRFSVDQEEDVIATQKRMADSLEKLVEMVSEVNNNILIMNENISSLVMVLALQNGCNVNNVVQD